MQYRELAEMHAVEVDHWWFAGKRTLFKRLLRDRLAKPRLKMLDVGSGTGAVPQDFQRFGWICATDRSVDAMRFAQEKHVTRTAVCDATALPFADRSMDLVLAFDIIEHVEDDRGMLEELARVLKPGGAAAIHVPAWPSMWSRHDEVLEHKRRYTRRGFRQLLEESPLEIEYLGWASASIFPPAFLLRTVRRDGGGDSAGNADIFSLPEPLNTIARGIYRVEAEIAATAGLPFGMSLAAVAGRP
jgi:SAM-dependent methyltransferase